LRQAEIARLLEAYTPPAEALDEDSALWLEDLTSALEAAARRERDLITLYL
jgi:hypothetical protein